MCLDREGGGLDALDFLPAPPWSSVPTLSFLPHNPALPLWSRLGRPLTWCQGAGARGTLHPGSFRLGILRVPGWEDVEL